MNRLKLVPIGNDSIEYMQAYFEVGAFGLGMGGSNRNLVRSGDWEAIAKKLKLIKARFS